MARWDPNPRLRLVRAAIDLFAEQGYDDTTVAQIAARAGLSKATFFRHFPDKREVLFAGQEAHSTLLAEGATAAPPDATPLEAVAAALDHATASFTDEQRGFGPRLRAVVAAHDELREREAFKRAGLAAALAAALRDRGVPDTTARLAADLGVEAFHLGYTRWTDVDADDDAATYPALARRALDELRAAAAALH
ncbi:TetR/AcrR family transcriptional regulator [Actinomycetospora sp. TBRC 11914]|uniref:TetR/AcrR family transcriptional regulator n=1 Tax=Actinomycetospora sp. TBRC 11914 TaxID=2729387 RepID=UPI00145EC1C0|nr:TetR/AcrR family transcriptional regulator [Actinomycetospora sp. TBRC 11914]NMO92594.1 TetR/AcrR family transcriptional regulator [Actinomycetospora sp. TBRC 11914]